LVDGVWQAPERISEGEGVDVVPALTATGDGEFFVIWTSYEQGQSELRYRRYQDGAWTEQQVFSTGLVANTSPTVLVDGQQNLWIAWAGFNGVSDELYISTLDESGFAPPQALTDNAVPDVQPVLGLDEASGQPWIQWQQYSPQGYLFLQTSWDGSQWSEPVVLTEGDDTNQPPEQLLARERAALLQVTVALEEEQDALEEEALAEESSGAEVANLAAMPDAPSDEDESEIAEILVPLFIYEPESATLFRNGYPVQSHPVRSMIVVE
jgi:hypothetical protein